MADILDVFGFSFPQTSAANFLTVAGQPLINVPPPGQSDLGGTLGGIITDIVQRLPLPRPRPRLPLPPGGRGPTTTGPTFPFPIPIPIPGGLFNGGGAGCGPSNPCCRGEHLNKSTDCAGNPPGSKCVSNRRMNPLNPRALRRATRRLKGFERAVKSTRKQLRTLSRI